MSAATVQARVGTSLRYAFLAAAGSRLISFLADVGLMRLLAVEAFGALAFGLLVVNALGLARSLGVGEALVWRHQADQESCDTAFVLSAALGVALCALVALAAPWIALLASSGDRDTVIRVLRALGVVVALQGLAGVPTSLLERALDFRARLWVDLLPTLVYAVVGLGLGVAGWGVWSLVWGRIAAAVVGAAVAWRAAPWRFAGAFRLRRAAEIVSYGRFVVGAGAVSFLVVNVDDAVVARLTGIAGLGLYARAYLLGNLPATAVTHVVGRVAFPAYARLRQEPQQVRRLFGRLTGAVMLLSVPAALGLILLARPLSVGLFGTRWEGLAPLLPWLGLYGAARALLSCTGPLFNALGRPQAILEVNLVQLPLVVGLLAWLVPGYGPAGACAAVLAATVLSAPLALRRLRQVGGPCAASLAASLRPLVLPAAGMAAACGGARLAWAWCRAGHPLAELVVAGALGTAAYGALLWRWRRPFLATALGLLRGDAA